MRLAVVLLPLVILAVPFAACAPVSSSSTGVDGSADVGSIADAGMDEFEFDSPFITPEAGGQQKCSLNDADPVGLCVQKAALSDMHAHAFAAMKGVAGSWNSTTLVPDKNEAGVVPYSVDDTVAYAAAIVDYLASAEAYGDTSINASLQADLQAVALQLETSFTPPSTEYSGELYFHLRTVAAGLRKIDLKADGDKIDTLADNYGRAISAHYVALGNAATAPDAGIRDAGAGDATVHDAAGQDGATDAHAADATVGDAAIVDAARAPDAGKSDARSDAGSADGGGVVADGIIGNLTGNQVAYATADVATAAYALLDMVDRYQTEPAVPTWLAQARAALVHLQLRAKEPTTGMFYTSLVTTKGDGGATDTPVASTNPALPSDALLADTQATFVLAIVRAQALVTSTTVVTLTGLDGGEVGDATLPTIGDGGVTGPLVPVLDLPLEAWADATIAAMNGTPSLLDSMPGDGGTVTTGYMDGYVVSTKALITTKSTRTNAFMAAAIVLAHTSNGDLKFYAQRAPLVKLLITPQSFTVPLGSSFLTLIPEQVAFFRAATQHFQPLDAGATPLSYTSAAVSAAVEGLNEQLTIVP